MHTRMQTHCARCRHANIHHTYNITYTCIHIHANVQKNQRPAKDHCVGIRKWQGSVARYHPPKKETIARKKILLLYVIPVVQLETVEKWYICWSVALCCTYRHACTFPPSQKKMEISNAIDQGRAKCSKWPQGNFFFVLLLTFFARCWMRVLLLIF